MSRATLIVVGTEIVEGVVQDTHTRYLAGILKRLGFRLESATTVPDDPDAMAAAIRSCLGRCELAIVTGGLGPTSDDRTREVIGEVTGRQLHFHPEIWQELQERWRRWHGKDVEPAASNKRQAYIPEGFQIVKNEVGSAPGFIGTSGGCRIVALPGPPHELRHVVESQLVPLLEAEYELTEEEELRGTAFLVGESSLEDAVQWAAADSGVRWGTRAEPLGVDFYIRGGSKQDRDHVFDRIVERLDGFRIRRGSAGAAEHLSAALKEYRRALVTAESCTGGMILSLLTDIPGSSEIVWGGFVTYSNDAKRSVLGVAEDTLRTHGAVSVETVTAMVEGALNAGGADVAIAVSGIAGPSGGTPEKPVGTVYIGVGLRSGTPKIAGFRFVGGRDRVRRKSSVVAMLMAADVVRGSDVDLDTYDIC